MDGGAWWAAVHGVAKSRTRLSDFLSLFTFMHWRRQWQPTPVFLPGESQGWGSLVGSLPSMGSQRAGHDRSDLVVVVVTGYYQNMLPLRQHTPSASATKKSPSSSSSQELLPTRHGDEGGAQVVWEHGGLNAWRCEWADSFHSDSTNLTLWSSLLLTPLAGQFYSSSFI